MESQRSSEFLKEFLKAPHNKEAFGKFAARYLPRMKACCLAQGLQDADAEDLTAALLLHFLERDVFSTFVYQSRAAFNSWLATVVRRAVYKFVSERGKKPDAWSVGNPDAQASLTQVMEKMLDHLSSVYEEVEQARARVEGRLDEKHRQAFGLLVDEGLSAGEVAGRLGLSKEVVWQVRSRVSRALREELPDLAGGNDGGRRDGPAS